MIGLARRKPSGEDGDLHHLFLKDRHPKRALKRWPNFVARIVNPLQPLATAQVRMHHAALNRARPDNSNLNHEVIKAARAQAGQHGHLCPRFDLEHADRIAA